MCGVGQSHTSIDGQPHMHVYVKVCVLKERCSCSGSLTGGWVCTHVRVCRVGQNYIIYIRCIYGIFGRVITKCAVIYSACIHTVVVSPGHVPLVCANTFADSIACPYSQLHICTLAVKHTHTHTHTHTLQ